MADHTQHVHSCEVIVTRGKTTRAVGRFTSPGQLQVTRSMGRMEMQVLYGHHTGPEIGIARVRMGAIGVRRLINALEQQLAFGLPEEE